MSEHQPRHHETGARSPEHEAKIESAAAERLEHLRRHTESAPETDTADRRAEAAREIIHKQEPEPETPPAHHESEAHPTPKHSVIFNTKLNYAHTLASVQRHLSPTSRAFSKLIHTPVIERSSEAIEQTVARPSVTVGATWTALILGSIFYLTARRYGYSLSGSEVEFSFVVGAALGLLLEWAWRKFIRRPH